MTSFDEQLAAAAPPVPVVDAGLDKELAAVASEAESLVRARGGRRRKRWVVGGLVAVGAIGVGTAAAGAAGILPWFDEAPARTVVTTSTGTTCELSFGVKGIEDAAHPVSGARRDAAVAAAEAFLVKLDLASIDVDETRAALAVVQARVDAELERRGLPATAVGVSMASSCHGDGDGGER